MTIRQNDPNPMPQELFTIAHDGSYQLTWVNTISTANLGNFIWHARVRTQDGREATESVNVTIVPDEGLQLELNPAGVQRRYSVVEQGAEDKQGAEDTPGASEEGAGSETGENGEGGQDDGSDLEATGNLPQTNATQNTLLIVLGTMLLALVGGIILWKKRSTEKEGQ